MEVLASSFHTLYPFALVPERSIVSLAPRAEPLSEDEPRARDPRVEGKSFYERYRETACHPVAPKAMPTMSRETMVSLCCLEEGQVDGNLLHVFVQLLAKAHNAFLDRVAALVGRTQALRFKLLGRDVIDLGSEVALNQLQEGHMLLINSLQMIKRGVASHYGICQPGFGRGKAISFSFDAIEFQLAVTLLTSVSRIASNPRREIVAPAFEFAGEVIASSVVHCFIIRPRDSTRANPTFRSDADVAALAELIEAHRRGCAARASRQLGYASAVGGGILG